ncbi:hypothetical protein KAU11_11475 [Candidatus Babeliales bacterium]|nr:hypothetical protein [Candidatus Babeliales bacterium]
MKGIVYICQACLFFIIVLSLPHYTEQWSGKGFPGKPPPGALHSVETLEPRIKSLEHKLASLDFLRNVPESVAVSGEELAKHVTADILDRLKTVEHILDQLQSLSVGRVFKEAGPIGEKIYN